ncbi:MAG: metallophosphoesterase family protein [Acidobacteria bacterium]|nr:metallophosphoesterase family protein [Acidobacteriota bacterium]
MRIAILSDIHDHVWNLAVALEFVRDADAMVCCGDLCSPFVLDQLARGFGGPIHIVFGNNDADTYRITAKTPGYPHVRLYGEFFEATFGGRRVAVNHFHNIALAIAASDEYEAVFYGHNHVFRIHMAGERTLAVNPGSIMGCQFDGQANRTDVAPTFAIYDTGTGMAQGYRIEGGAVVAHG